MHLLFVQIVKWIYGFRKWFFAKCICKELWMHIWVEFMMHRWRGCAYVLLEILKCDFDSKTTWDSLRNIFIWNVLVVGKWQRVWKRTCNDPKDLISNPLQTFQLNYSPSIANSKVSPLKRNLSNSSIFFSQTDFNKVFDKYRGMRFLFKRTISNNSFSNLIFYINKN